MKGSGCYEDLAVRVLEQKGFKDSKVLESGYLG